MIHRTRHVRLSAALALGATFVLAAACDTFRNPLDVEESSRIPAENVETPANALLLVNGAIADFECAFAAYAIQSATVGEEFVYAQQTAARTPSDRRNVISTDQEYSAFGCTAFGIYVPLQTARATAETVLGYLQGWSDAEVANRTRLISTAAAYAGYSYVFLGEGFCTMAISRINPDRSTDYGGEISRDSTFRLAIARFTEAINGSPPADIVGMAYIGRARAKLNIGDYAGAKADAQQITSSSFVKNATYDVSPARRTNLVWNNNASTNRLTSVGEPYRTMGDTLSSTRDLRVRVARSTSNPITSATGIVHWVQLKYTLQSSPIPIARWAEAQLIIAEADVRSGSLATALPIINASRTRGGQAAFTGTTQAQYLAEIADQRRRELFLESHHLGDLIRFGITPTPAVGTVYHFGGNYSNQLCFPLPSSERLNNPRIGS